MLFKTTEEIVIYALSVQPIYSSPNGNLLDYYLSVEESIIWMNKRLFFQLQSSNSVKEFIIELLLIIDKRVSNRNTFFIQSPQNAGKSLFFDAVIHFFFSFGQIRNFFKYSNFPLMECVDKRILLWNEPQCELRSFETLKMLFGGDTCNVNIKYEADAILARTPIIILANCDPFPKDVAFRTRMSKYYWNTYDDLIHCNKKIFPLAFHHILLQYNIYECVKMLEIDIIVTDTINTHFEAPVRNRIDDENNVDIDIEQLFNW